MTIALLDAGFNHREHQVFAQMRVKAVRDFVNGDDNVSDETGQPVTGDEFVSGHNHHGSRVLSIVGGYDPGNFIGVAPEAEFLLAKRLGKAVFPVLVEATPFDTLPPEIAAEWKLCDLVTDAERRTFRVAHDPIVPETEIALAESGLARFKTLLQRILQEPSEFAKAKARAMSGRPSSSSPASAPTASGSSWIRSTTPRKSS